MTKKKKPGDTSDSSGGSAHSAQPRRDEASHLDKGSSKSSKIPSPEKRTQRHEEKPAERLVEGQAGSHAERQPGLSPKPGGPEAADGREANDYAAAEAVSDEIEQQEQLPLTGQLEEEIRELKDQLLRKQAEFENFRKRLSREKADGIRYSNQMLLLDLLPVIDDFERAIASAEESKDFHAFHDGVVLIERQLTSLLEKNWGLKRFESLGDEFNPEKHQAIALEESDGVSRPTVIEDYQKGYFYHERVLRPAKVKVAQPKKFEGQPENSGIEESQGE